MAAGGICRSWRNTSKRRGSRRLRQTHLASAAHKWTIPKRSHPARGKFRDLNRIAPIYPFDRGLPATVAPFSGLARAPTVRVPLSRAAPRAAPDGSADGRATRVSARARAPGLCACCISGGTGGHRNWPPSPGAGTNSSRCRIAIQTTPAQPGEKRPRDSVRRGQPPDQAGSGRARFQLDSSANPRVAAFIGTILAARRPCAACSRATSVRAKPSWPPAPH